MDSDNNIKNLGKKQKEIKSKRKQKNLIQKII